MNRINKIAISAMKQSRQHYLPEIHDISPFNTLLKNINEKDGIETAKTISIE